MDSEDILPKPTKGRRGREQQRLKTEAARYRENSEIPLKQCQKKRLFTRIDKKKKPGDKVHLEGRTEKRGVE